MFKQNENNCFQAQMLVELVNKLTDKKFSCHIPNAQGETIRGMEQYLKSRGAIRRLYGEKFDYPLLAQENIELNGTKDIHVEIFCNIETFSSINIISHIEDRRIENLFVTSNKELGEILSSYEEEIAFRSVIENKIELDEIDYIEDVFMRDVINVKEWEIKKDLTEQFEDEIENLSSSYELDGYENKELVALALLDEDFADLTGYKSLYRFLQCHKVEDYTLPEINQRWQNCPSSQGTLEEDTDKLARVQMVRRVQFACLDLIDKLSNSEEFKNFLDSREEDKEFFLSWQSEYCESSTHWKNHEYINFGWYTKK
jgi:DNA polymerase III delta prime subunit